MAGNISLESSIRTCKVDTAYANKVQSDRFMNPSNMICPIWNGLDSTNRRVCADSFYTKSAGCNSAEDRVMVENNLRPQYMEYINLSANGIDGSIYGAGTQDMYGNTMAWNNLGQKNKDMQTQGGRVGNFGFQLPMYVTSSCSRYAYDQGMNQVGMQAQQQQQQMQQMPQMPAPQNMQGGQMPVAQNMQGEHMLMAQHQMQHPNRAGQQHIRSNQIQRR
jgi:hypothetical protein